MTSEYFAMVRRDELWVRGVLTETRSSQGQAVMRGHEIVADDLIDDPAERQKLRERCNAEMDRLRRTIAPIRDARVRGVVTCTPDEIESTVTITLQAISVVTTPDDAVSDYQALKHLLGRPINDGTPRPLPIVWRNGSGAVLLHEAIGHAAEHGHKPLTWPRWLRARDIAADGLSADLLAGERPRAIRRESFRDVPLRRMTKLMIEQFDAPFALPDERIEVQLVSGGAYEPLTEMISVHIAVADLVTGDDAIRRLPRFTARGSRLAISRALIGATGDPIRYPGVICSREGQELFVASHAPVMVTTEIG